MKNYLYKQFYRNKAYIVALLFLFLAGLLAIYTGKKFLDKEQEIISKTEQYQKESIEKNIKYHKEDLGLILYYIKFNLINATPQLAALNIGMRDIKPSIQGVTIRNLEEQRYNADFYNPANAAVGNFDLSFVLVFLFPLIIVAFCYDLISEEEESGRWKLLSVQSSHLGQLLDAKLIIRFFAVSCIYLILIMIAKVWVSIPINLPFIVFILTGCLYILFWFALCRWVVSFRRSSAQNALTLLTIWVGMNFIVPMGSNIIIQKYYPVQESLKAVIQQREGYHNKWDEAKRPTMEKFYLAYPQFKGFKVEENDEFTWTWYYAMQHMGDVEASLSSKQYAEKMLKRNRAADLLGYFLPNVHTQLTEAQLAETGMSNQLEYGRALQRFHEEKRLSFYPLIFSGQNADAINWDLQTVVSFGDDQKIDLLKIFSPYLVMILLLIILSQYKFRKLC